MIQIYDVVAKAHVENLAYKVCISWRDIVPHGYVQINRVL